MASAEYIEILKDKKFAKQNTIGTGLLHNFPGGPIGAKLTGQIVYALDGRVSTSSLLAVLTYDITITATSFPELERASYAPATIPYVSGVTENVFYLSHQAFQPWRINPSNAGAGLTRSTQVVGSITANRYTRATTSDPWVFDQTYTDDYLANFFILIHEGGDPVSGGRGSNSLDKKVTLLSEIDGTQPSGVPWANVSGIPFFPSVHGDYVTNNSEIPYPWDAAWPDVSSVFTDSFNSYITILADTANAYHYNTTGSSCTLKMGWVY